MERVLSSATRAALLDLAGVMERHKITLEGCSCCSNPYISAGDEEALVTGEDGVSVGALRHRHVTAQHIRAVVARHTPLPGYDANGSPVEGE